MNILATLKRFTILVQDQLSYLSVINLFFSFMCILYLLIFLKDPSGFIFMNSQINSFYIFY